MGRDIEYVLRIPLGTNTLWLDLQTGGFSSVARECASRLRLSC
jgi:hypothetical protein